MQTGYRKEGKELVNIEKNTILEPSQFFLGSILSCDFVKNLLNLFFLYCTTACSSNMSQT